jgi:signal transduction histidine kinase
MPEQDNGGMGGPLTTAVAWARAALLAPVSRRARDELLFCLAGVPLGLGLAGVVVWVMGVAAAVLLLAPRSDQGWVVATGVAVGVLLAVALATRVGRRLGAVHRRLAARLLGTRVPAPPPPGRAGRGRGVLGRLAAGLEDGPGWRAVAYQVVKLPLAFLEAYAVFWWAGGLANLTYPFWWGLFRNHPPGVTLDPVPVATPFPGRLLQVATFGGTFLALGVGLGMVVAAPWVTRAVVSLDRRLLLALLGPGRLALRVRDLEQTRALAVDDAAAQLRRVERDLHDGAQIRLATLAMHLGLARETLAGLGEAAGVGRARELVDAAHQDAKQALGELRDLARGIHPPVLDSGLEDALATLAATSAIPVELACDLPERPAPAIETIAYYCAAELLANAAKHSHAGQVTVRADGRHGRLMLEVGDDGVGGADPGRGSGLAGLAQRVSTVDGRLRIASPRGGPTLVSVHLPLRT